MHEAGAGKKAAEKQARKALVDMGADAAEARDGEARAVRERDAAVRKKAEAEAAAVRCGMAAATSAPIPSADPPGRTVADGQVRAPRARDDGALHEDSPVPVAAEDPDTIIATGTKRLEKFVAEPPRRGTSSWADAAIRTSATRWRSASP